MIRTVVAAAVACATVAGLAAAGGLAASATTPAARPAAQTVRLVTGDSVSVRTVGGVTRALVTQAGDAGGRFRTMGAGARRYLLPAAAQFYAGHFLDPELFDVTRLAAVESAGRVPVTLAFPAGSSPSVPGVTVTARSGSTATGYVTAASGRAFGAALLAQWKRDAAPGAAQPTSLLGATHIALDAPALPAVHPDYPQVTLVLKVLDGRGKPVDFGYLGLINTDNAAKFINFLPVQDGIARASVPLGHYSAITDVATFGTSFSDSILAIPDVTVTRDLQTVTFDARKATATPSVSTPRPAAEQALSVEWDRQDTGQGSLSSSFFFGPGDTVRVTPTPAARVGAMHWLTGWSLAATPDSGPPYSYDLSFDDAHGIPADQHHTVAAASLATVNASYFTDGPKRNAQFLRYAFYPFQFFGGGFFSPLKTPLQRTEYVSGGGLEDWTDSLLANTSDANPFGGEVDDGSRLYAARSVRAADWLRGPLGPGVLAHTNGADPYFYCGACRSTGTMAIDLAPVTDTTPGHAGYLDPPADGSHVARFRLYRNGTLVYDQPDVTGGEFAAPAGKATYRVIDSVDRRPGGFVESTQTTLDETFVSSATSGGSLPAKWNCSATGAGACRVLPLLQVHVPLPETLDGRLPVGRSTVPFTVEHVQGAVASAIRSAGLATSTDGRTWTAAPVTALGSGRFAAAVTNPRAGAAVSLRVTATDAAGGSLTQTTTDAYLVG